MPFVPLAAMGAIVYTLINLLKNAAGKQFSAVITQVTAWVSGVAVVALFAQTDWADTLAFGDRLLSQLNGSSQLVIGLMASSLFGVVANVIKAVDRSDSAATPPLIRGANDHIVHTEHDHV